MKFNPKTWNELLDAGYVIELNEETVGLAKRALNPRHDDNIDFWSSDEIKRREEKNQANEARMRNKIIKKVRMKND